MHFRTLLNHLFFTKNKINRNNQLQRHKFDKEYNFRKTHLEIFLTCHILEVLSKLQEAKNSPSKLQSKLTTVSEWPFSSVTKLLLAMSQILILLSSPITKKTGKGLRILPLRSIRKKPNHRVWKNSVLIFRGGPYPQGFLLNFRDVWALADHSFVPLLCLNNPHRHNM